MSSKITTDLIGKRIEYTPGGSCRDAGQGIYVIHGLYLDEKTGLVLILENNSNGELISKSFDRAGGTWKLIN